MANRGSRSSNRGRRYSRRGRRRSRRCAFCVAKDAQITYKNASALRPYLTNRGKLRSRRQTKLCGKHQRLVAQAVKRARHLALLPFTTAGEGRFPGR